MVNPYDFANAVADSAQFAGRERQLDELTYYLRHAAAADRPIHVAILGPRGAGKTSLLNVVESQAAALDFCVVRINLDEGDVLTPLRFFQKFLDSILGTAIQTGAFGGVGSPAHRAYLEAIYSHNTDGASALGGLTFPLQYALSASAGSWETPVSDSTIASDLELIRAAVNRPLLVMVDEANVLGTSRTILQKLRNALMRSGSCMLVVSATPDLFPQIDEVFSPVSRQFRRIVIDAFEDQRETEECIIRPLLQSGLDPSKYWDFSEYPNNVRDVHELTGGRPYEIKRLCHEMFRQVQSGRARQMHLNIAVLETVMFQLENEQLVAARPIMTAIRALDTRGLQALATLVACNGSATLQQLWEVEYIFAGMAQWTMDDLRESLGILESQGILRTDSLGRIAFAGDDSDRIYATYRGRAEGVPMFFPSLAPLSVQNWVFRRMYLELAEKGCHALGPLVGDKRRRPISDETIVAVLNALAGIPENPDLLNEHRRLAIALHRLIVDHRGKANAPALRVSVEGAGAEFITLFSGPGLEDDSTRGELAKKLEFMQSRAKELGGEFAFEAFDIPLYSLDMVTATVEASGPDRLRAALANEYAGRAMHMYRSHHDREAALQDARLAYRYGAKLGGNMANNLGYIFLMASEWTIAGEMFANALRAADGDVYHEAIILYNQAILLAQRGDFNEALAKLSESARRSSSLDEGARRMAYLLIGDREDGRLRFVEHKQPDLLVAATQTRAAVEASDA